MESSHDLVFNLPWNKENLLATMSEFRLPSSFLQPSRCIDGCYTVFSGQELAGRGSDLDLGMNILNITIFYCSNQSLQDLFLKAVMITNCNLI
jgi:hypothetical protein